MEKDLWTAFATGSIRSSVGHVILAPTTFQVEETTFRLWTQQYWSPGLFLALFHQWTEINYVLKVISNLALAVHIENRASISTK